MAFHGPVPALGSLTFPGGPATENPSDLRLLWGSEPVLRKIHTFDPLEPLPAVACSNPFPMEAERPLSEICKLLEAWVCPGDSGQTSRWFPHIALTFL